MAEQPVSMDILGLTAQIVAAHLSHNPVPRDTLPSLIQDVYRTLNGVGVAAPIVLEKQAPAVPVKKSVFADHIVCLEDGKQLSTAYGMTPEQYRAKWNLPADYPMVAPNYAKHRSSLAKRIGLGTKARIR
jgi:predicted transcriptional regulator